MCTPENYSVYVECDNCNFIGTIEIQKGFTVITAKCPNCNCKQLKKSTMTPLVNDIIPTYQPIYIPCSPVSPQYYKYEVTCSNIKEQNSNG